MIKVTESAWNRVGSITSSGQVFRVGIESGGCHGFQYVFKVCEQQEDDILVEGPDGKNIVIARRCHAFLEGGTLNFVEEVMHSHFVFDNPKVETGCGCGISFQIPRKD